MEVDLFFQQKKKEIDRFCHEHPLIFIESEKQISRKHGKKNVICKGCQKFCTFPLYACTETDCSFYLHKSCVEFPMKFRNPFHPHGLLTLRFEPDISFPCRACFKSCNGFYFQCEVCNFDLHVDCAFAFLMTTAEEEEEQQGCKQLQHSIHLHPLILVDKKDEVFNRVKCHICGKHCFGACYGCDPCGIFLHKPCAEFQYPQEIQNFTHSCPLTLQTRVHSFRCQACDTCMMGISYRCEQCRINIDVECALLRSIKSDDGKQIKHFNHRHPLNLIEKLGDGDQVRCFACGQGCLGTTYYVCSEYKWEFSLHKSCADSAPRIYDYLHPDHPLSLILRSTNTTPVRFRCNACCGDCCDLTYRCGLCDFNLHRECTGQVPTIKYENHRHLLLLGPKMGAEAKCNACESTFGCDSLIFRCPQCDFNLHVQCGPLPYTIKHKCHVDSLTLTDSPVEDDSDDEFYCDVCEEERNPRFPFYYCAGCQFVAEVSCVISEVMLWLKGEYGDVELRSPEGKFAGKVISERTEAMEMCKKEAAEATKILNDPGAEEMQALHDLLSLDRLLKFENVLHQMEVAHGIRRQIKPQIGGTGVLTWNHILSSFSEDEHEELKEVLMTEESIDEENSSEDELDSLDNSLFLDKAFTDLSQIFEYEPKELMDLWNRKEQVVNVRDYLVPQSLAPILESLFEKYGDVGAETNLSPRVKMYLIVILCGTIDSMCCTRILDITEDKLLNWWQYLTALESAGFKIQFVHDQGMRFTKAYFGLRLRKLEEDTLQELETDITKYDAEVKELTTKLELIKDKHERITSEKSGKRSSLIEDCLRMAAKLKWKKAGAGLIKLG